MEQEYSENELKELPLSAIATKRQSRSSMKSATSALLPRRARSRMAIVCARLTGRNVG